MQELSEYIYERDRQEFSLGDTLDIKTGVLLASLTFLAIQSGSLIGAGSSLAQSVVQVMSIFFEAVGGICCVIELWPRDYMREAMPDEYEAWILSMDRYHVQYPDASIPALPEARAVKAKQRIGINGAINKAKSTSMFIAFYCVALAFSANLATLVIRLF